VHEKEVRVGRSRQPSLTGRSDKGLNFWTPRFHLHCSGKSVCRVWDWLEGQRDKPAGVTVTRKELGGKRGKGPIEAVEGVAIGSCGDLVQKPKERKTEIAAYHRGKKGEKDG